MDCGKKPFQSAAQAKKAAIGYAKMTGKSKQKAYFCAACKAWHLTTRDPSNKRTGKGRR